MLPEPKNSKLNGVGQQIKGWNPSLKIVQYPSSPARVTWESPVVLYRSRPMTRVSRQHECTSRSVQQHDGRDRFQPSHWLIPTSNANASPPMWLTSHPPSYTDRIDGSHTRMTRRFLWKKGSVRNGAILSCRMVGTVHPLWLQRGFQRSCQVQLASHHPLASAVLVRWEDRADRSADTVADERDPAIDFEHRRGSGIRDDPLRHLFPKSEFPMDMKDHSSGAHAPDLEF
ncbi:hypothetical protein BD410DRAFT_809801 [Rickenella mellea]|uniref:Uncharacterized protein n=1 Tax=Rickenella mellea TaxID=50990 RepID=A0A4Y7PHP9_9AGAM|nr:hypothetical protein BD410DRAFT_809801 [Rickenella mellea]